MDDIEHRTMARVTKRLVPFLILCYFIAYLDRVNVGFAVMGWVKDRTGDYTYGLLLVGAAALVAMVIVLALGHDTALEKTPAARTFPAE